MCPPMAADWHPPRLPWGHIDATWRIRLNLCFLRTTRAHNPNGKSIGSAVLHSSHSQQKVPVYQYCKFRCVALTRSWIRLCFCIHCVCLCVISRPVSWLVCILYITFFSFLTALVANKGTIYFTIGALFHQNCPFPWEIWAPRLTSVSDRQIDRQTTLLGR